MMLLQKIDLHQAVDAVAHGAQFVRVGAGEAMAQRDIAIGRDAHQTEACAARIRLADAFMDLFQRVFHIRESVMPVLRALLRETPLPARETAPAC